MLQLCVLSRERVLLGSCAQHQAVRVSKRLSCLDCTSSSSHPRRDTGRNESNPTSRGQGKHFHRIAPRHTTISPAGPDLDSSRHFASHSRSRSSSSSSLCGLLMRCCFVLCAISPGLLGAETDSPRPRRSLLATNKRATSIPFSSSFGFQVARSTPTNEARRTLVARTPPPGSAAQLCCVPPSPLILILPLVARRATSTKASAASFVPLLPPHTLLETRPPPASFSQNLELLLVARVQPLGSSSALCPLLIRNSFARVDCKRELRLGFALGKQAGERVSQECRSLPYCRPSAASTR
ncbi:hypothetical protein AAT19DRAFT_14551 [Rhodotorula toruloides]|uniref:Uncharacterized protein n=1 Tax=Rhodotorula toruloides TaxID=5286 RepID=A0A2T0A853_RHOTO|nr:hypothetical protein AAT19DRAFT_14551 [Rhodotorula toruloides]